jgi:hypothetical protein
MKNKLKAALLVGALLGIGAQSPLSAAPAKKAEQHSVKKATSRLTKRRLSQPSHWQARHEIGGQEQVDKIRSCVFQITR